MKGLLIKDMKLMLGQIMFLIFLPVVGALIVVPTGQLDMGFGYITSISGVIAVTTVNYDFYDNGYSFLFTLPVGRKEYVKEKYVFSVISSVVTMMVVGVILWLLVTIVHPGSGYGFIDFIGELWSAYMVALVAIAFLLPVYLEFGAERSRYFILIIWGIFIAVLIGAGMDESMKAILGAEVKRIVFFIISIALLGGSYMASCSIMERKEF